MRQRVAFLRTLIADKPLLALDEPFASLDAITRAEMQEWLAEALAARPAHGRPRHPRRRGGALPLRSRRGPLGPPGAGRGRAERAGATGCRPRRKRHRPEVRRGPGAGDEGTAGGSGAMKRWLPPALLLIGLIGAWQLAASSGALAELLNLESFLVPSPAEIAEALWQNRSLLAENAWVTLREVLLRPGPCGAGRTRFRRRHAPLRDHAPGLAPADRRLAGDPDPRRRPDPGRLVRLLDPGRSWRSSP